MRSRSRPRCLINNPRRLAIATVVAAAILVLSNCGQNYNSNSNDVTGSSNIDCGLYAKLCTAYPVIQHNHCFQCHSWSGYRTDEQWVQAGLVVPGSPNTSSLIKQLQNTGGDMPKDYSALSSDDIDTLKAWIQAIP